MKQIKKVADPNQYSHDETNVAFDRIKFENELHNFDDLFDKKTS